jgi:hypothetical protein
MTETPTLRASFTRDGTNDMFVAKYLLASYPAIRRLGRRELVVAGFAVSTAILIVVIAKGVEAAPRLILKLLFWLSICSIWGAAVNTGWLRRYRRLNRNAKYGTARPPTKVHLVATRDGVVLSTATGTTHVAWSQVDWVGPVSELYIGIRSAYEIDVILIPFAAFGDRPSTDAALAQLQEMLQSSGMDASARVLQQTSNNRQSASCQGGRTLDPSTMSQCPDCGGVVSALSLQLADLVRTPWWRLWHPFPRAIHRPDSQASSTHCPECGYSLRGVTIDRCPECGTTRPTDSAPLLNSMSAKRRLDISRGLIILQVWIVLQLIWEARSMIAKFVTGTDLTFSKPIEQALTIADWGVVCVGSWLATSPPMRDLGSARGDRIMFWTRVCTLATMCTTFLIELLYDEVSDQLLAQGVILAIAVPSMLGHFALILAHQTQLAMLAGDAALAKHCRWNLRLAAVWLAALIALGMSSPKPLWITLTCAAVLAWGIWRVWVALSRLRNHLIPITAPTRARGTAATHRTVQSDPHR